MRNYYPTECSFTNISKMDITLEESINLSSKQYSDKKIETVFVKEEILEDMYKSDLESISGKAFNATKVDVDIKHEKIPDVSENLQISDENVFIKTEILDEVHLQSCEKRKFLTQYSDEKLKLLLHIEEILDNVHNEEFESQPEKILENGHYQSHEPIKIESNGKDHKQELLFICTKCQVHFISENELIQHDQTHNKNISYCNKCQEYFPTRSALKKHVLVHLGNKKYSCSTCKKSFTQKDSLKAHILLHTISYSCSVCSINFAWKSNLRRHMLIHSSKRPYSCSICMKGFNQKAHLDGHMLIHSNERPHSCSVCKKSFVWKNNLVEHMLVHSNKRHYSCSVCLKGFSQKSHLNRHMLIHSDKHPYSCSICNKGFNQKGNLDRHALIHANERPHSCPVCIKSFPRETSLTRHLLIHKEGL